MMIYEHYNCCQKQQFIQLLHWIQIKSSAKQTPLTIYELVVLKFLYLYIFFKLILIS